jgi:hypothetical protein
MPDYRDTSIQTQVSFKGAIDLCHDLDLTTQEGQGEFIQVFSFLTDALIEGVRAQTGPAEQAAEIIRGNFPGTTTVQQNTNTYQPQDPFPQTPTYQPQPQQQYSQPQGLTIKGQQHGPIPDWLYAAAAAKGVTEVYDNRDRAAGTKRPLFRSTTGGENAPAFWEPR